MNQDKIEHWAFGFVLSIGVFWYEPLIFGGVLFTALKEIYDIKYGTIDVNDAIAGVIGVFSVLGIYLVVL